MHYINNLRVEQDAIITDLVLPSSPVATTLNGTLQLTVDDNTVIYITGSATGYTIKMPDATTIPQGHKYEIMNTGTAPMTISDFAGTALFTLGQNSTAFLYLLNGSTQAGLWNAWQIVTDPGIASGILNYNIISSTPFSTTSATDVAITSFSITPQAGRYAVWFSARMQASSGSSVNNWSVYNGGTKIIDSERGARFGAATSDFEAGTITVIYCDGSQSVDVRVRRSGGTLYVYDRSLLLIRLGAS